MKVKVEVIIKQEQVYIIQVEQLEIASLQTINFGIAYLQIQIIITLLNLHGCMVRGFIWMMGWFLIPS